MYMDIFELLIAPIIVGVIITFLAYWLKKRDK